MDLARYELAFLDVETTGLSPRSGDRVCEIAILRSLGDEILDRYETLVNPVRPISYGASQVNGIGDSDVRDAPRFGEIADRIEELLAGAVIVCHNAPFDLQFVGSEFGRLEKLLPVSVVIDTLNIARTYFRFGSNSLPSIARALRIKGSGAHRAMADVEVTRAVFHHFVRKLEERGLEDLEELMSACDVRALRGPYEEIPVPPHIRELVSQGSLLRITYVDRAGRQTCRDITPLEVYSVYDQLYLLAYCHMRDDERSFRLDRILELCAITG